MTLWIFLLIVGCNGNTSSVSVETINDSAITDNTDLKNTHTNVLCTNKVDANGIKQSYWYFLGLDFPERGYSDFDTVEAGYFVDGFKVGEWTYYNKNGSIDSVVTY